MSYLWQVSRIPLSNRDSNLLMLLWVFFWLIGNASVTVDSGGDAWRRQAAPPLLIEDVKASHDEDE
eukprot:CAMPEP_0201738268 /NCGR_PEP_ID=MMETSP0593-20130828/44584_1 /ASSEMBLY_ACC=CAM_ASM_000672 /TAXON_ID=267983 /ORGANISM="Skeletonema japonicum, Strain CCMP2506" /LENGTH=65 /DNA_ID=CAMNT_0048232437 /DNA_START=831 /DNA_END=1025 /DNA_ORIENTATION=-